MIDISNKYNTLRFARAKALVELSLDTMEKIRTGNLPKQDPLAVARVAAIQAAKKTWEIVPYCHPIPLDWVNVEFDITGNTICIIAEVKAVYKTGVEMEAMTAASVAAITLYDMLKPVDADIVIREIRLEEKKGGKSDYTDTYDRSLTAAVIVVSDSVSAGEKEDRAGKAVIAELKKYNLHIEGYDIVPDEKELIEAAIKKYADEKKVDMILTCGGTGLGPRDVTVDVTAKLIEREVPGISETIRKYGTERTPYAMLSRAIAGVRGRSLIVNLPGSTRGATESIQAIMPGVLHIFHMMAGRGHNKNTGEKE